MSNNRGGMKVTLRIGKVTRRYGNRLKAAMGDFKKVPKAATLAWQLEIESQIKNMKDILISKISIAGKLRPASHHARAIRAWFAERGYPDTGEGLGLLHTGKLVHEALLSRRIGRRQPSEWHVVVGVSNRHKSHVGTSATEHLTYSEIAKIAQKSYSHKLTPKMMAWFRTIYSKGRSDKRGANRGSSGAGAGAGGSYIIPGRPFFDKFVKDTEEHLNKRLKAKGLARLNFRLVGAV